MTGIGAERGRSTVAAVRRLLPHVDDAEVTALDVYGSDERPRIGDRPWVVANMVASVDGATAVDGVSGALGADGDHMVFTALRTIADVVLVASGTANAERYGPVRTDPDRTAWRAERGKPATARLGLVTGSLSLDPELPCFTADDGSWPLVVTCDDAPADRRALLSDRAEIVDVGPDQVDLDAALRLLGDRGAEVVLTEGGPGLLGQLITLDLVDELCLTVAPMIVGGTSRRVVHGALDAPHDFVLDRVLEHDGELLLRYLRPR